MTFSTGDLIGGRYRLDELIGSGGMGQVFRAHDTVLARSVAIKIVDALDSRRRNEITQVFLREARISAAIDHRNVVRILDFGTHGASVPFMVMELLEGESLGDVLGRGDAMPFDWLVAIVSQVLDGLSAAHEVGVVHRDLKPENIFLVRERTGVHPKILDFGISKVLDSSGTAKVTTTQGHVVGTPAYMSPEQARGIRQIDQRTDIYSMGVVLYELLCGHMPFYSENPGDLMLMIMTREAQPLIERVPEIGPALHAVVAKAMSKRPEERFATAHEMQDALMQAAQQLLGGAAVDKLNRRLRPTSWRSENAQLETLVEQRVSTPASLPAAPRRIEPVLARASTSPRRWLVPTVGVLAAALGIGLVAAWFSRSSADPSPRFIVVRADAPAPADAATLPTQPSSPGAQQAGPEQPAKEPSPTAARKPAVRSTADVLAETFRNQKGSVVACIAEHATEAAKTQKLAVKLALTREGSVEKAAVHPRELSGTPMGTCIETAVRSMRFPAQTQPISFEVPLTARRGS